MLNSLKRASRAHPRVWLALMIVLPVLIGVIMVVSVRASSVEPDQPAQVPHCPEGASPNPDGTCHWSPTKTAKKFRDGYYKRAHGIDLAKYVKQPAKARKIFERKVYRQIERMTPRQRAQVAKFVNSRLSRMSARGSNPPKSCDVDDWVCLSRASVFTVVKGANCRGGQYYSTWSRSCRTPGPPQHFMSLKEVKVFGGAAFCGGTVVIGTVAAPASGTSTGWIAGWGATSCMFSTWAAWQE